MTLDKFDFAIAVDIMSLCAVKETKPALISGASGKATVSSINGLWSVPFIANQGGSVMIMVACFRMTLAVSLISIIVGGVALGASDRAINAWVAKGTLYPLSEDRMLFQGEQKGTMFIRHEEGKSVLFHAGRVVCPVSVDVDLKKDKDAAQGMCSITDQNGDKAFAKWSCTGPHGDCRGTFAFTGGTGQFQGITGESDLRIRVDIFDPKINPRLDPVEQSASGYMLMPRFNYVLR